MANGSYRIMTDRQLRNAVALGKGLHRALAIEETARRAKQWAAL